MLCSVRNRQTTSRAALLGAPQKASWDAPWTRSTPPAPQLALSAASSTQPDTTRSSAELQLGSNARWLCIPSSRRTSCLLLFPLQALQQVSAHDLLRRSRCGYLIPQIVVSGLGAGPSVLEQLGARV